MPPIVYFFCSAIVNRTTTVTFMTQEYFIELQSYHQKSGLSIISYLQQIGISYTTYNYWQKKLLTVFEHAAGGITPQLIKNNHVPSEILKIASSMLSILLANEILLSFIFNFPLTTLQKAFHIRETIFK